MEDKFQLYLLQETLAQLSHGAHFGSKEKMQVFLNEVATKFPTDTFKGFFSPFIVWVPAESATVEDIFIWGAADSAEKIDELKASAISKGFKPECFVWFEPLSVVEINTKSIDKRERNMEMTIPSGTKFPSKEALKKHINDDPLLHGINVVVIPLSNGHLEVHDSTHNEIEAQELLECAKAVAENSGCELAPYVC